MRDRLRLVAQRALELSGYVRLAYARGERRLAEQEFQAFNDGRPMPPPNLRVQVAGTASPAWFSESGKRHAERFLQLTARHGHPVEVGADVLDFGCGCGRIGRWIAQTVIDSGGRFVGTDLSPKLVSWCAANLPGHFLANRLLPPLALPTASFDVVYAYSVFTHLRETSTRAWLTELARVLRPGSLALLTFHDEAYAAAFAPAEVVEALRRQPFVVHNNAMEGSNYLSSWSRADHFAKLSATHFDHLETIAGSAEPKDQAVLALRRR